MKSFTLILLFFLVTLTCATPAVSYAATASGDDAPINWTKGGKWSDLTRYIGTYDYSGLLEEKDVRAALKKLLGDRRTIDLQDEFAVQAPIGFENDCLILKGNPPQKGDIRRAYMTVCLHQGTINLALWNTGKTEIFTAHAQYQFLPEGLRSWIYLQDAKDGTPTEKPDNVTMIAPK